ncbi:PVC-type heme-binding CxxCH protein [Blastopirellula marina]|uniref:Glucose dehydrogenase-B [pyrroloquinoline-quinone]-like protein n=1 Tax=Blastopirellula marina DSM 3645 TaxID=314230 RepID=A3ZN63_9BACT|nr:PVC-type heme-binding CxxCH protein [Blastopirellula marina]EAQ81803.1 glucose dehydrogenase-B [pyrroloquinoline-quinone] precursor-like protein [Blastopirellula marina DSM 3645]
MLRIALFGLLILFPATVRVAVAQSEKQPATLPLVISADFENGAAAWSPTDPASWSVVKLEDGSHAFKLSGVGKYKPPHRSPFSLAILKDKLLGDFVLTAKAKTLQTSRGHRDMVIAWGMQDPANFYYVHLGEKTDDHSNQIFVVDDAPRIKISDQTNAGTPWKDDTWHQVKVVRKIDSGLIEVYFDDMKKPQMVAHDKRFVWGEIAIGSFDDMGLWDDVKINGVAIKPSSLSHNDSSAAQPPVESKTKSAKEADKAPAKANDKSTKKMSHADPSTLEFFRWSGDVNVPDPVAISLDNQGRAYVTQTKRRKSQDLDIRANKDWIPDDVGFEWPADKQAFFHAQMPSGGPDPKKKRVDDLNRDGVKDWHDLTMLSEQIHRLEDVDGDGTADKIETYADGFQTEITGIAAGVLWHDGDVFATIAPDVWRLRDTNGDGQADHREIMATGFGFHIAYAGHDMHGLTVGPDGKIYWSVGDKGIHVVSQEGREFRYPNQGGVMRCNPDGSDFEVFAHGLRNVQELAFDTYGNLFGVDNDSDQKGEKERFVYIAKGIDAGWRCNYQYRGDGYNPWMAEELWQTRRAAQPAYLTPPLAYSLDGPAGFTFNPGTALSPEYKDYFFLTGAPGGVQVAFQAETDGASFTMTNQHKIGNGVPLVGINFGPDGGLYGVDWGGGYPLNEKGAVWKIDVPAAAKSPARTEVRELLAAGFAQRDTAELTKLLAHVDQRIRLESQFQLVKQGDLAALQAVAKTNKSQLARIHAIWGLGQLGRQGNSAAVKTLGELVADGDAEIRAQTLRTISDLPRYPQSSLTKGLEDESPRVRFFAAQALAAHPACGNLAGIASLLAKNNGADLYLRHAGAMALAARGDVATLAQHPQAEVRLAAVVALRQQANPDVAQFLQDADPRIVREAVTAIHDDFSIPAAMPAMAELLTHDLDASDAVMIRVINANYRLGDAVSAGRLIAFAENVESPLAMRLEAIDALAHWRGEPRLDRVDGRNREKYRISSDRTLPTDRLASLIAALLEDPSQKIRAATLAMADKLNLTLSPEGLQLIALDQQLDTELRVEAMRSLTTAKSDLILETLPKLWRAKSAELRLATLRQMEMPKFHDAAVVRIGQLLSRDDASLGERQVAIDLLGRIPGAEADALLVAELEKHLAQQMPEVQLELEIAAAAKASTSPQIAKLAARLQSDAADTAVIAPYRSSLFGGDAKLGEKIFMTHLDAACIRCHRIGKEGSDVGPALDGVAKRRDAEYLLRSIVAPSAEIEPKYRATTVLLVSGKTVQGIVTSEDDDELVLRDAQGKEVVIPQDDVDDLAEQRISLMPEMTKVLSRRQLRDVAAYLQSLK